MTDIEQLPNLGLKSSQWLRDAGVVSLEELRRLGAVLAFRIVKSRQPNVSLNLLWALAAGLEGKHWRDLDSTEKRRLKRQLEELDL